MKQRIRHGFSSLLITMMNDRCRLVWTAGKKKPPLKRRLFLQKQEKQKTALPPKIGEGSSGLAEKTGAFFISL
ncbi:hypothetical protein BIZ37_05100 [Photobacterium sp. BZF1]|uniref:hypothetical protein n=1 Tax=Photobacterium sp. BZF1 TaxID=1904457 RepID=UPI001653E332|nr:hypothetical protein [Photobacterium sp. BZF1]MBC7001924.1 hypothetical protein [Photobacterium sp. BZF1]